MLFRSRFDLCDNESQRFFATSTQNSLTMPVAGGCCWCEHRRRSQGNRCHCDATIPAQASIASVVVVCNGYPAFFWGRMRHAQAGFAVRRSFVGSKDHHDRDRELQLSVLFCVRALVGLFATRMTYVLYCSHRPSQKPRTALVCRACRRCHRTTHGTCGCCRPTW